MVEEARQRNLNGDLLSPQKYLFNLCIYVILPSAAVSTAIILFVKLSETEKLKLFVCKDIFIGDGFCHDSYNVAACQFDLGDCCLPDPASRTFCKFCKCFDSPDGQSGNEYSTTVDWHFTVNKDCPEPEFVGDGFCDDDTNNYMCAYDGGDCCLNFLFVLFCSSCICHIDQDKFQLTEICMPIAKIGDFVCDDEANIRACNYDGGDCCLGNVNRANCIICICDEDLKQHPSIVCPEKELYGDQVCDPANNVTTCNFDGGDCVEVALDRHPVAHTTTIKFAETVTTSPPGLSRCKEPSRVANGFCDDELNIDVCDYDGGDCCLVVLRKDNCGFCICHSTNVSNFGLYNNRECQDGIHSTKKGNGLCEDFQNTGYCGFDGGDCCLANPIHLKCDKCQCHEDYPDCWFFTWINDGVCDDLANNPDCGYDGGDCCQELIDDSFCKDCICNEDNLVHPAYDIPPCRLEVIVGDKKCHDETNTASCKFDGGDCCMDTIDDSVCKTCICNEDLTRHPGWSDYPEYCNFLKIKDGHCHDNFNKPECTYDGGDCCLPEILADSCNICVCKEDNTRHPTAA